MPYKTTSVFTEHTNLPNHSGQITRTAVTFYKTKAEAALAKLFHMRKILQILGNKHVHFCEPSCEHGMQALEQLIQSEIKVHNIEGTKYEWTLTCEETAE